jgi:uncharacterized protein YkwD
MMPHHSRNKLRLSICAGIFILSAAVTSAVYGQSAEINKFRQAILRRHNELRARHGVPALTPDGVLNRYAQNWAEQLAASGTFRHSGGKYGENLYYASSSSTISATAAAVGAADSWYGESAHYRYGSGFSPAIGHFTQLVWKGSVRLGCGMARASDGANNTVYVVCSYDPPGNFAGEFRQNVFPPR